MSVDFTAAEPAEQQQREAQIVAELQTLEIKAEARRRFQAANTAPPPPVTRLDKFLEQPDEAAQYRIDGLLPVGGRSMLAAQFKAGKSTMVGNLVRSLADGTPFLGAHEVSPFEGTIVILDTELDERMLRSWLRQQGVQHTERVVVLPYRGRVSALNLLDPATRTTLASRLIPLRPAFVILDCLRPVIDALGLSEDKDAGKVVAGFDELLGLCGASEGTVVHHMGHAGERTRGDSRLRDWPDVEWTLVRESEQPGSARFFRAYGRDVDVPETALTFDPTSRRLSLATGNRKDARAAERLPEVLELLAEESGLSGRRIEERLAEVGSRNEIRSAIKAGLRSGHIVTRMGPKRSTLHHLADGQSSAPARSGALNLRLITQDQDPVQCAGSSDEPSPQVDEPVRQCATSAPPVRQRTESSVRHPPPPYRGGALGRTGAQSQESDPPTGRWRVSGDPI